MAGDDDRCCCNLIHVKTATWIIAVVEMVFVVIQIVQSILNLVSGKVNEGARISFFINLACWILFAVIIVLLIMALLRNKASWMVSHLISSLLMWIWMVVLTVMMIVNGTDLRNLIASISILVLFIFFIWIEYRCYKYLCAFGG